MAGYIDVIVIGGGYAGVMAANRLTQRDDVTVTLINPRPDFVERIRLHQLVAGNHEAVLDYREVLSERVRLVVDTVSRIDPDTRRVELTDGGSIGYDYLIYAVGSVSGDRQVPGAAEFAHSITTLEEAQRLRPIIEAMPATAPITVVGAGPTGIEIAAELAEQGRSVTLACGAVVGPYLHPRGRRAVSKRMATLGVAVLEGAEATVTAVTSDAVHLTGGQTVPSAVTIWTAGFGVPDLAAQSGLMTDTAGRLLTDETLTSVDDPRIIAAGDAAAPSGVPFRMSCQSATRIGAHAADTVLARIAGGQPEPINLGFFGQCISLGRRGGIFQFADKHDTANRFYIAGRAGAKLKEFVCKHTITHLSSEAHKPGSLTWVADDKRRQLLHATPDDQTLPTF
ncbi:NAD(P)/FAD-dependent oxidoreductase [Nocardia cyriacigeorgica]|uniref:NAD(P)/FAD-dependent oxidoreductase n=1 Tax=Nocardia cyriacigeorgica TaxID=135487 RepID=UPI001895E9BD|nr:FAD-dependent oxidoreductase [Nocardia cyriacigeorgica]MBF6455269.1 FAD-dependent oxidoreductase [Nocardia cyriacigeorgica]MBF6553989.1 FAD-dependent oxidoreductase [Nocardia cyriacigeorgica]